MLISTLLQSEADNRYCPNAIHAIPPLLPTQRLQLCRASLPDPRFQPHLPCLTSLGSRPLDPLRLLKNPRYPQETARHHPLILRPPFPPPRQEGRHRSFGGGPERTRERADEGVSSLGWIPGWAGLSRLVERCHVSLLQPRTGRDLGWF